MPDDAGRTSAEENLAEGPPDTVDEAFVANPQTAGSRRRYLAAFIVTVVVVIVVLGLLPSALVSMYRELRGQAIDQVYDLFTGEEVAVDQTFGLSSGPTNRLAVSPSRRLLYHQTSIGRRSHRP